MNRHSRSAFTLIELLIVIAVIAILSVVVILILNPAQLLQQSRDANRVSDAATLKSTVGLYSEDTGSSLGSSGVIYVSIPDPTATSTAGDQCQGIGFPSVASDTYHCAASSTYKKIDGTGWIPINFNALSFRSPIGSLPIDPVNTSSTGYYYTYETNGTNYEITMALESSKDASTETSDGGQYSDLYEVGTGLALAPIDFYASSTVIPPVVAFITSGSTWSATTNGAPITVEAIGGGASGGPSSQEGGGGGEYCKSVVAYVSGTSIPISIGQGGTGGAWGTATTWNTNVVVAVGGEGVSGGSGGTGTTCYNGGAGTGNWMPNGGPGGGGAGGPHGAGLYAGQDENNNGGGGGGADGGYAGANSGTNGGSGGNNYNNTGGGAGGTSTSSPVAGTSGGGGGGGYYGGSETGAAGGAGTEWSTSPTYGSGGGGGGGSYQQDGGNGGLYGGGGGGPGYQPQSTNGVGAQGILVITYVP